MEKFRVRVDEMTEDGSWAELMTSENDGFVLLENEGDSSSRTKLWGVTPGQIVDMLIQDKNMRAFCAAAFVLGQELKKNDQDGKNILRFEPLTDDDFQDE